MEAMILAAGLGTRLRPLTHRVPKALVEVGGVPILERVARRLVDAGADRLVINVSPHADQIRAFITEKEGFGVEVSVSEEPDGPLETGGGLLRAAPLFRGERPFVLHNVDLLTDLDLRALIAAHGEDFEDGDGPVATLAVRDAATDRYLLFDDRGLMGWAGGGEEREVRPPQGAVRRLDFCGVQVLSPRILGLFAEEGKFSIISTYLRLVRSGERVAPHHVGGALCIDIGTHERLEEANRAVGGA